MYIFCDIRPPGARAAARHGGARGSVRLQGGPVPQLGVRGQAPGHPSVESSIFTSSVLCCAGAADLQPHQGESQGRPH